jgi:hypothetical protein
MFRSQSRLIGYLLPIALAAVFLPAQVSAQKKQQTVVYAPPSMSLTSDTAVVSSCQGSAQVRLNARASSPNGNPIRYRWSTSAGRLDGNGSDVVWDLSGLAPGVYRANVDIETGDNDGVCNAFTSTTVVVKPCPPPPTPTCPNVEIICPTNIAVDQPLTFSSNVSSVTSGVAPIYNWSVSAGTIIEGQGTPTIKVDTTGLAGQTVKATLSMGGYKLDCSASCAVSIPIPEAKCRKFDEFPDISRNDEKARLDNYGVELQNDPTSTAYVVVHPGRSSKPGDVQKHITRVVDYLVNSRGIDARRLVTQVGGARDELMVELWTCPQGATPPRP